MDMEVDPSQENRWNLQRKLKTLVKDVLRLSFSDLNEQPRLFSTKEEFGDYQCENILSIWLRIRDNLEKYPNIKKPTDVGEEIKKHLKERDDMIKEASVHDIGFVTFKLSGKWIAESIHNMVRHGHGIEIWAPKLNLGKVMINYPSLENDTAEGTRSAWFRRSYIINTLIRILKYCKADVTVFTEYPQKGDEEKAQSKVKECFSIEGDGFVTISVVEPKGERKPIICGKKDGGFGNASKDLSNLSYGIEFVKAEWIVNVIPVQQQEYYEMCYTAAREVLWLPEDRYESPGASFAGYRTCSNEVDKLITLLQQMQTESVELPTILLDNALAYTFLKTHRLVDCTLNLVEMFKEEGNSIRHLLRTLAKIRSFTTKSSEDVNELKKASQLTLGEGEVWEGGERILGLHLLTFTEVLKESCASILPHILCEYLHELSEKFELWIKSYESSVCEAGVVVEPTTRLLLYEATAVVMEKCFHILGINLESSSPEESIAQSLLALSSAKRPMNVNAPIADVESDSKKQKKTVGGASEDSITTHLLSPVVVRDPPKNPRFEPFSICLNILSDRKFRRGKLLGQISVSDNVGLLSDAWAETFESECGLVHLFNREWCDSEDIDNFGYLYFGNISTRQSIPFSSYMEICMKLFVTNDKKDAVFQLCDHESDINFSKFWKKDIDSTCCAIKVPGEDGHVMMYYILLKDAVDAAIELTCTSLDDNQKVY